MKNLPEAPLPRRGAAWWKRAEMQFPKTTRLLETVRGENGSCVCQEMKNWVGNLRIVVLSCTWIAANARGVPTKVPTAPTVGS